MKHLVFLMLACLSLKAAHMEPMPKKEKFPIECPFRYLNLVHKKSTVIFGVSNFIGGEDSHLILGCFNLVLGNDAKNFCSCLNDQAGDNSEAQVSCFNCQKGQHSLIMFSCCNVDQGSDLLLDVSCFNCIDGHRNSLNGVCCSYIRGNRNMVSGACQCILGDDNNIRDCLCNFIPTNDVDLFGPCCTIAIESTTQRRCRISIPCCKIISSKRIIPCCCVNNHEWQETCRVIKGSPKKEVMADVVAKDEPIEIETRSESKINED